VFCEFCGLPSGTNKYCSVRCSNQYRNSELRKEVLEAYGGRCQCPGGCPEDKPEFLGIDHIRNDGRWHRYENPYSGKRKTGRYSGVALYRLLKSQNWPKDNYRLLCYNCNMSRSHFGKCPHERNPMKLEILAADRVDSFVKSPDVVGIKYVGPTLDGRVIIVFSHKHEDGGNDLAPCIKCGQSF
jgi:hypothetical protein